MNQKVGLHLERKTQCLNRQRLLQYGISTVDRNFCDEISIESLMIELKVFLNL